MKRTVDIADGLLAEAEELASRDQTTLHALIEEGLREIVQERKEATPFKLRKASFRGKGLQAGLRNDDWQAVRALAYEGKGE